MYFSPMWGTTVDLTIKARVYSDTVANTGSKTCTSQDLTVQKRTSDADCLLISKQTSIYMAPLKLSSQRRFLSINFHRESNVYARFKLFKTIIYCQYVIRQL